MDVILRLSAFLTIAGTQLRDRMRDERGQASTEYAGILFVIVAIITAVVTTGFTEVGTTLKDKIVEAVGKVGS